MLGIFVNGYGLDYTVFALGGTGFSCWCTGTNSTMGETPAEIHVRHEIGCTQLEILRKNDGQSLPPFTGYVAIVRARVAGEKKDRFELFQTNRAELEGQQLIRRLLAYIAVDHGLSAAQAAVTFAKEAVGT